MSINNVDKPAPEQDRLHNRSVQIVIAAAVTLLVTLVFIFFTRAQAKSVTADLVGYKAVNSTTFEVTFSVDKAYIAQVTCKIDALDKHMNIIGSVDNYVVGPQLDHHRKTIHTVEIPVSGTPVTGEVESCIVTRDH